MRQLKGYNSEACQKTQVERIGLKQEDLLRFCLFSSLSRLCVHAWTPFLACSYCYTFCYVQDLHDPTGGLCNAVPFIRI